MVMTIIRMTFSTMCISFMRLSFHLFCYIVGFSSI